MFKNKFEKNMFKFINTLIKTKDYHIAFSSLPHSLSKSDTKFIIAECIKAGYISGISVNTNLVNMPVLNIRKNVYVTRAGYTFVDNYKLDRFNFFWIPFKSLIIISVTALITAIITTIVNNSF